MIALEIPDKYEVYSPSEGISENYLLYNGELSENRILIFGPPRSLEILHFSKFLYCDGTFKVAPTIFAQVYVILAEALNGVHPLIYALLLNKQEKTYDKLFDMLNVL